MRDEMCSWCGVNPAELNGECLDCAELPGHQGVNLVRDFRYMRELQAEVAALREIVRALTEDNLAGYAPDHEDGHCVYCQKEREYFDLNTAWGLFDTENLYVVIKCDASFGSLQRFKVECWDVDGVTGLASAANLGVAMYRSWLKYWERRSEEARDGE